MAMNNFKQDLAFSHQAEDLDIWPLIYAKAFPGFTSMSSTREDGQMQRVGVDRTVVTASGKAVYIDEKVRRKPYDDILLEYIANDRKNSKGWVEKPLFCDYIAYAILPKRKCYVLPVQQLQTAWLNNKLEWIARYGKRTAKNENYNTINCPVAVDVLFAAIGKAFRIDF